MIIENGKILDFDGKDRAPKSQQEKTVQIIHWGGELKEIHNLPEGWELEAVYISDKCKDHEQYALGIYGVQCPACKRIM